MNTSPNNLSITSRAVRIGTGLTLALGVSAMSGPLGAAAILPLLAIYPLMTGAVGWDPVITAYNRIKESRNATVANTSGFVHAA